MIRAIVAQRRSRENSVCGLVRSPTQILGLCRHAHCMVLVALSLRVPLYCIVLYCIVLYRIALHCIGSVPTCDRRVYHGVLFCRAGVRLVQHCLDRHTVLQARSDSDAHQFPVGSMWEYIDDDGHPYSDANGAVISDPGHAVRFGAFASHSAILSTKCNMACTGSMLTLL